MSFYRSIVWPVVSRIDPETAHERTAHLLEWAQGNKVGRRLLSDLAVGVKQSPVKTLGLTFPNVLGVAAGFDKNVTVAPGLALLGFGHVEVGTLTPHSQEGNPRPRIFRLPEDHAIINRMGFPNCGVAAALPRLRQMYAEPRSWVLGVSLGKQKDTPLAEAAGDYVAVMREVYPYADYLAVNISSPNTPDLRELQGDRYLRDLLTTLVQERDRLTADHDRKRPLLVKIAPDLSVSELDGMLELILASGIEGIIATNTTLSRPRLQNPNRRETGGLSGRPLTDLSTNIIERIRYRVGPGFPIIGVGGVFDAVDVRRKLDAGATLVQVYTGLIYRGPGMAGQVLRELEGR